MKAVRAKAYELLGKPWGGRDKESSNLDDFNIKNALCKTLKSTGMGSL